MTWTTLTFDSFDPLDFLQKARARLGNSTPLALFHSGDEHLWSIFIWDFSPEICNWADLRKVALRRQQSFASHASSRDPRLPSDCPFLGGLLIASQYGFPHADPNGHDAPMRAWESDHFFCFNRQTQQVITSDPDLVCSVWNSALPALPKPRLTLHPHLTRDLYRSAFDRVQDYILAGDIYQMNLTYFFKGNLVGDPALLFESLCRKSPSDFSAFLDMGDIRLISVSPERFIQLDKGRIETCPVKGTRPRGKTPQEDEVFQQALLSSEKERAELAMITDLLRNDIGQLAQTGTVQVVKACEIQKHASVFHTHSVIEATLNPAYNGVDLLERCLPGGSISGCPKKRACEVIAELEVESRGWYTGVLAFLSDHGRLDSSILIRTLVQKEDSICLGIGGGIVADSRADLEYEETLHKAAPFLSLCERFYWKNGELISPSEADLAFLDPSRPDVLGVFETLRTQQGVLAHPSRHLERLKQSMERIALSSSVDFSCIPNLLDQSAHFWAQTIYAKTGQEARFKLVLTADCVLIRAEVLQVDESLYEEGVAAHLVHAKRDNPRAKALPYSLSFDAHAEAEAHGAYEAILVDPEGFVTEGAYSNLFWVKNGQIFTREDGVLEGITRGLICEQFPVQWGQIRAEDLPLVDELFLTKTSTGPVPIVRVNGQAIGDGKVGGVFKRVRKEFLGR